MFSPVRKQFIVTPVKVIIGLIVIGKSLGWARQVALNAFGLKISDDVYVLIRLGFILLVTIWVIRGFIQSLELSENERMKSPGR